MNERSAPLFVLLLAIGIGSASGQETAPREVLELARTQVMALGRDPVIVVAVRAENAKGKTLAQIRDLDRKWIATPGIADFMDALISSECGDHLREIQTRYEYFAELFVMDRQGALVASTDKTSDYWQGDEPKFIESYNQGRGGLRISDVQFDESSQAYVVHVSVPVRDGNRIIGALTAAIDPGRL